MKKNFECFFDLWPDLVVLVDLDGNIVYANQAWETELGWTKQDLLHQHYSKFVVEEERSRAEQESVYVFGGKSMSSYETRCRHKNGKLVWTNSTARLIPELNLVLSIGRNVDFVKRQAERLRQGSSFFQQVIDAVEEFVLVKGPKSQLLWANKAFRDYYGMTNSELLGMIDAPFNELDFTQQYVKDDNFVFENAKPLHVPSEPVKRHDGVIRNFYTVKSPIFDEQGKVIMTVGISRDITDIQEAQSKAIESAKMATLGEMAAGIAHEINNPLAVITGLTSSMRDRAQTLRKGTGDGLAHDCERIEKMAMRIARIVKGLRTFSRNSEDDPFSLESLKTIVEDTLSLCHDKLKRKSVEFRLKAMPAIEIQCRSGQLTQILINLINNAIDAVEGLPERWVELEIRDAPTSVEILITDSGKGISTEIRKRIMQPFFTTKDVGMGTGLGLSISRGIAEEHGGTLAYNEQSAHTQFSIHLPKKHPSLLAREIDPPN